MSLTQSQEKQYITGVLPPLRFPARPPRKTYSRFGFSSRFAIPKGRASLADDQMSFSLGDPRPAGGDSQRSKTQVQCCVCNKTFAHIRRKGDKEPDNYFCGRQCRQRWAEETPSFAVSLEGRGSRHRGADWSIQSRRARERDQFCCQVCGVSEEELGRNLDVHHKIPYSSFQSNAEANKLENLISVCPSCHGRLEAQLRRDLPLFRKG